MKLDYFVFSILLYAPIQINSQIDTVYTSIETALVDPSKVFFLDLSNQNLKSIPSSIGVFENLIEFNLSNNKNKKLPKSIGKLSSLKYLNLENNKLKRLPSSIGYLTNLRELNLFSNNLKRLPESIGNLILLKELDFHSNKMRSLPQSISSLTGLKKIILEEKYFTLKEQLELEGILPKCEIVFEKRKPNAFL